MRALASFALAFAFTIGAAACDKPGDDDCKRAVQNIRELTGTAESDFGVKPEAAVRSCRGNASKTSVKCAIAAESLDDLRECGITEEIFGQDGEDEGNEDGEEEE